jgi:hypothetical protein
MRTYREESRQGYWDEIRNEGLLRFVMLRGSLAGLIMGSICFPSLGTFHPLTGFLFMVFWWAIGLILGIGTWFLCLHREKKERNRDREFSNSDTTHAQHP